MGSSKSFNELKLEQYNQNNRKRNVVDGVLRRYIVE